MHRRGAGWVQPEPKRHRSRLDINPLHARRCLFLGAFFLPVGRGVRGRCIMVVQDG